MLGARCPLPADDDRGSWYFVFEAPMLPSGDRRRVPRGGFPTYESAQRGLDALRDPMVAVAVWLKLRLEAKDRLRGSTRRSYSELSRNHVVPILGEVWLVDLVAERR
jgi:hypothetical protein